MAVDPDDLMSLFNDWMIILESDTLYSRASAAESAFRRKSLIKKLTKARAAIANSRSNGGMGWLLGSSAFVDTLSAVSLDMRSLATVESDLRSHLAKDLRSSGADAVAQALKAGRAARSILSQESSIGSAATRVAESEKTADEAGRRLRLLVAESEAGRVTVANIATMITQQSVEAERMHAEMISMREVTEAKKDHFESVLESVQAKSLEAGAAVERSTVELKDALESVKRLGLAGAFTTRAGALRLEWRVWIVVFVLALSALSFVAFKFGEGMNSLTYESLVVGLLRRVALAAPLIWLGWYSARQLSLIAKIKEDYEYKAATALAFEGYQREMLASGNESLRAELLSAAIATFGSNPVRLYPSSSDDSSSPAEQLIKKLPSLDVDSAIGILRGRGNK
ncbi:hypothetical protein R1H25_07725 [Stenotrophomonas sp. C2852]|uniref:hypothetical protein n=1 Tax=Stenotrophomonas sp. C2852 TaxID=3077845 RepID=UPI00293C5F54|nr:hypothetical protein [Stenotrophomonas sp. C2852]MDV3435341.1 hypothetical protein [Stenotrophomonas sp. C2852]